MGMTTGRPRRASLTGVAVAAALAPSALTAAPLRAGVAELDPEAAREMDHAAFTEALVGIVEKLPWVEHPLSAVHSHV